MLCCAPLQPWMSVGFCLRRLPTSATAARQCPRPTSSDTIFLAQSCNWAETLPCVVALKRGGCGVRFSLCIARCACF